MSQTFDAIYDGSVLRPEIALDLEPNTRVKVTVESADAQVKNESFLDVAESLNLSGPPDWARNIDRYLYGTHEPRT